MRVILYDYVVAIVGEARRFVARRRLAVPILVAALIVWSSFAGAQRLPGNHLDRSFGGGDGRNIIRFRTGDVTLSSVVRAIGTHQNGKIVLAGETWDARRNRSGQLGAAFFDEDWTEVRGFGRVSVARLLNDGRLDPTFGNGDGLVRLASDSLDKVTVADLALYGDGRILVGGTRGILNYADWHDCCEGFLLRLLPDGRPDPNFGSQGVVLIPWTAHLHQVEIDGRGRIVVCGNGKVARFNSDGTPDTGFGRGGIKSLGMRTEWLRLLNDGKLLVLGNMDTNSSPFGVVRFNLDGSRDRSFGVGGKVELPGKWAGPVGLEVQDTGAVIVVGRWWFERANHWPMVVAIARITSNGQIDERFNHGQPLVWNREGEGIRAGGGPVASGKHRGGIVVMGNTSFWDYGPSELFIAKFDADGRFEGEFDIPQQVARETYGNAFVVRGLDQRVIVGGLNRVFDPRFPRLLLTYLHIPGVFPGVVTREARIEKRVEAWPHFVVLRFSNDPAPPVVH